MAASKVATLTDKQRMAYDAIMNGENVFLTGKAGTGKSYVIDAVLADMDRNAKVIVCAPTGTAALNIKNGTTIHRAFKIGVEDVYDPQETGFASKEIAAADTIIIDEISMVRLDLFDRLANIIKFAARRDEKAKQVVVVGDFFQLPPVMKSADRVALAKFYPNVGEGYCFNAFNWDYFNFNAVMLDEIVRQEGEPEFIDNLNAARHGDDSCLPFFNELVGPYDEGSGAIRMVGTNAKAKKINTDCLESVKGQPVSFKAATTGKVNAGDKPTDDVLTLKVGCRVMSIVNDTTDDRYQNGSLGTVKKIGKSKTDPSVTVAFDNGHVAKIKPKEWSITRPEVVDGANGKLKVVHKEIGSFTQIPLKLAYAITIHKSQGKTLDACYIDPASFAHGQLYVALSRCKSSDGITLERPIKPGFLSVSQEVADFYERLANPDRDDIWESLDARIRQAYMVYGESARDRIVSIVNSVFPKEQFDFFSDEEDAIDYDGYAEYVAAHADDRYM